MKRKGKAKTTSKVKSTPSNMTFEKAIEFGEYNPEFLATYPEWHTYSRHVQFQYIRKALDNRNRQLIVQWAEVNNILDFHKKPHLKTALKNIERQLALVEEDRERLYLEYSS